MKRSACCLIAILVTCWCAAAAPRFEVSFPPSAHSEPITGRVFVILSHSETPEPRFEAGNWQSAGLLFGADVDQLRPGQPAAIGESTLGYPANSLKDVATGDYCAQAVINIYTRFSRADGHTIWAHMDQWEGQQFNFSPGNLYSQALRVHFDPAQGGVIRLELTKVVPPVEAPPDTQWVKRVKIQSKLLSQFWGRAMYLGATVLLPKGYDQHPTQRYPVIYSQGHFGLMAPFGFSDGRSGGGRGRGDADFARQWMSDDFPRVIVVTFQHPTPYFDDSYAVNSANNGPYGDALLQELIPYLEEHFRMIREPRARTLTGGSTGGWESLALQVFHPDFFNGTWTFFPDPVDFRRYQLVNIYEDDNAFQPPGFEYVIPERPMMRTAEGQVTVTMRGMSRLEEVLGSKGRSCQQFEAWEAVYGPMGPDGYPRPLWDKRTGKIDREVATYMRDHGYDLGAYLSKNWDSLGPRLKGKLHLYCGDMDNYYLNLAVYLLEDFLKTTNAGATFDYGRPMKGHGWHPDSNADLVKMMAAQMQSGAAR